MRPAANSAPDLRSSSSRRSRLYGTLGSPLCPNPDERRGEMLGWSHSKPNERSRVFRRRPVEDSAGKQPSTGVVQRVLMALRSFTPVDGNSAEI